MRLRTSQLRICSSVLPKAVRGMPKRSARIPCLEVETLSSLLLSVITASHQLPPYRTRQSYGSSTHDLALPKLLTLDNVLV